MRFEPSRPNPYEMYVYLGRQNYESSRLQSEPDLNPYLNLTLSGLGYGFNDPFRERLQSDENERKDLKELAGIFAIPEFRGQETNCGRWRNGGRERSAIRIQSPQFDGLSLAKWSDPLGAFLGAKKEFLGKSIADLLREIEVREKMRDDHLHRIDYESCSFQTRIYELDFWQRGMNPIADRVRTSLEKEMSGLEKEKRMEEISCWRDVSHLKTDLREVMQEWAMEKRKDLLLSEGADDGSPGNL